LDKWFSRLFIITDASWIVVSAAFCILEENVLTYLYGANDRRYGNAWVSQYLHRHIIQYAQDNAIPYYDLLWASGLGSKNDRLEQVTQFKLGFGWEKLEYAWSRDLVVNPIAYRMYSFMS
jgi:lipid II:glycine glycyltransferase (peptidoglycan interpeptide bridge formation enzyme)